MAEFKDVYITANGGKIQWPILDIERITFDETSLTGIQFKEAVQMWMNRAPTNGPVWDNLDAALAEKGVEITRLKNQCNDKDHVLQDRWNRIEVNEKRIADLEKLSTMQKATIDSLGKALREAEKAVKCDGYHPKPCSGCRWENERCKYRPYAKGDHSCRYFEEPKRKNRNCSSALRTGYPRCVPPVTTPNPTNTREKLVTLMGFGVRSASPTKSPHKPRHGRGQVWRNDHPGGGCYSEVD